MAITKIILHKMLYNQYDFCCLCLKVIEENTVYYNICDEVTFSMNNTKNLFKILSCVLGEKIIRNLTDSASICHSCTETAIQAYKFISDCKEKSLHLHLVLQELNNYFEKTSKETTMCNTLFTSMDSECNVIGFSVNTEGDFLPSEVFNMLRNVPKIEENIVIEIEQESDSFEEIHNNVKDMECNNSLKLIDVIYDQRNPSLLKCKVCHNMFSRGPNLLKHYYSVHAPKMYKCSVCSKSFGTATLLKSHHNQHHSAAVCCMECGKTYSSVYNLQIHEKRHKNRYVCQHCGKVYKTKHAFQGHIERLHYGVVKSTANFICDYCGKKYSQKSAIRVHIQFEHCNGKFSECDWCKKRFSSISRLKEHIITHTKEKRFSCEVCEGQFTTKSSLLHHKRIHTGERPYQCLHCDASFLSASRRAMHVKQYHMSEAQECDVCHKKFKLRTYLLRHRHRHFDPSSKLHSEV